MVAQIVLFVVGCGFLLTSLDYNSQSVIQSVHASARMLAGWLCLSSSLLIHALYETRKEK